MGGSISPIPNPHMEKIRISIRIPIHGYDMGYENGMG